MKSISILINLLYSLTCVAKDIAEKLDAGDEAGANAAYGSFTQFFDFIYQYIHEGDAK